MGVTTRPTIMPLGAEREEVGSTMTEHPGDTGALLGNFPHTRYSCCGVMVMAYRSLTVPTLSGSSGPDQRVMQLSN